MVQVLSSTSDGGATGVDISGDNLHSGSVLTASAGSIYINGTVSSGTDNSREAGVVISSGSQVTASVPEEATEPTSMGDVTIFGSTLGSTAQFLNGGVFIEGTGTLISASGTAADSHGGTGLTITGFSSTINGATGTYIDRNNGVGGVFFQPITAGIGLVKGAEIETLNSAPIILNGTGGTNSNTLNSHHRLYGPDDRGHLVLFRRGHFQSRLHPDHHDFLVRFAFHHGHGRFQPDGRHGRANRRSE